ncbi:sensor histidine kinase [Cellulomonas sp. URHB0016]
MLGRLRARDIAVVVLALAVDLLFWSGARELRGGAVLPVLVIPLVSALVFASLLARWRRPVGVFAVQWLYALAGLAVPGYAPFAGLLVALHAVARCTSRRTARLALVACAVPFGIDCASGAADRINTETSFWVSFTVQLLIYALLAVTVWGFARHAREAQRRSEDREHALVEDADRAVREQRAQAQLAVREERLRLARELHDIVADGVTAMHLQAAGARTLVGADDERVRESLALIQATGVRTIDELQRMLGLLRAADPGSGDDFVQPPTLSNDLDVLVAQKRKGHMSVETAVDGTPVSLDRSIDAAAYRVVQEALTNTAKHAGRGAEARVRVSWGDGVLTITVRDARGLPTAADHPVPSSGYGLVGLAERVKLEGGTLDAGAVDGGFLVRAELPVTAASEPPVTSSQSRGRT